MVDLNSFVPMMGFIPEGQSGRVRIAYHLVTSELINSSRQSFVRDYTIPGNYCVLIVDQKVMMSDAGFERVTCLEFLQQARGEVLVAGLGLGMILVPALRLPWVDRITVLEKNRDVIKLIAPHIPDPDGKLSVENADVFTWPLPQKNYDTIWFDIWPGISPDNIPDIGKLRRRYHHRLAPNGWMGAWLETYLRNSRRRQLAHRQRTKRSIGAKSPPARTLRET